MMPATNAWSPPGRLLHASPIPPNPSPRGSAYVALCGETVRNVTNVPWRAGADRCPLCTATVIRVSTLMELRGYEQVEFDTEEMGR